MPKVTRSQVIGNRGENLVRYSLSQFCLVRQVASGTDVGIDLYCETLTDEQPNNHFWVQVKASSHAHNTISLEKEKLLYWWRQPIPVFVFLVHVAEETPSTFNVSAINLTEQLIVDPTIDGDSKTFNADYRIDSLESLRVFVERLVPLSIARQWLAQGMIVPAKPGIALEYFLEYPASGSRRFSAKILKNIGRTASMLLKDIMESEENVQDFDKERSRLEQILECFHDYGNWDMHYYCGLSKFLRGDFSDAMGPLKKALECIESDPRVDQNRYEPVKADIRMRFSVINSQSSLRKDK